MMKKITCILFLVSLATLPLPALAGPETAVLGSDGQTYQLRAGSYAELFPGGEAAEADSRVLALEVRRAGAEAERWLVPGTEEELPEIAESLFFEDASGTLYVFWEGWTGIHPKLELASFQDGAWSEVIEISQDPWTQKGHPQLAITRDSFELSGAAGERAQVVQRTILHVVWWEETASGGAVLYRPLVLLDGVYQEAGPAYRLHELTAAEPTGATPAESLVRRPLIMPGPDGDSVVIAFADAPSGHLVTFEVRVNPGDLGVLADVIRAHIIETGHRMTPTALGEVIRAHIIETGHRMNPRDLAFLAGLIRAHIIETGHRYLPGDARPFAGVIRAHIIETGARLNGERSLVRAERSEASEHLLELSTPTAEGAALPHLLSVSQRLTVPAVEIGAESQGWLYPSRDGRQLIFAWLDGDSLYYQEAGQGGWGDRRTLQLSDGFPLEQAQQMLERRAGR